MLTHEIRIDWTSKAAWRLRVAAFACLPAFAACAAQTPAANPAAAWLTITGLESLGVASASKAAGARLQLTEDALIVNAVGFDQPVSVKPWRAAWAAGVRAMLIDNAKPGKGGDTARFFRRREPFGLAQSVFITRGNARLPWLAVQSNAMSGQKVLGSWSVLHTKGQWLLQQHSRSAGESLAGQGVINIKLGTPLVVTEGVQRWCLHTLTSSQQPADLPLLDWVLIQQTDATRVCQPA